MFVSNKQLKHKPLAAPSIKMSNIPVYVVVSAVPFLVVVHSAFTVTFVKACMSIFFKRSFVFVVIFF